VFCPYYYKDNRSTKNSADLFKAFTMLLYLVKIVRRSMKNAWLD
jgi:hypothetical protein